MAITVNWKLNPDAKTYRVYRSLQAIDLNTLPTDVVEIAAADVVEVDGQGAYEYTDAIRRKIYYFVVGVEDTEGNKAYTDNIILGYFPESGPGPTKLLRGNWEFGFFGEVPTADLIGFPELYTEIVRFGQSFAGPSRTVDVWYKCVVDGRIIFIPNDSWDTVGRNWNGINASGLCPASGDFQNDGIQINKNGYSYCCRAVVGKTGPQSATDYSVRWDLDMCKSELGMLVALSSNPSDSIISAGVDKTPVTYMSLHDGGFKSSTQILSMSRTNSSTCVRYQLNTNTSDSPAVGNSSSAYNGSIFVVLELLF